MLWNSIVESSSSKEHIVVLPSKQMNEWKRKSIADVLHMLSTPAIVSAQEQFYVWLLEVESLYDV